MWQASYIMPTAVFHVSNGSCGLDQNDPYENLLEMKEINVDDET